MPVDNQLERNATRTLSIAKLMPANDNEPVVDDATVTMFDESANLAPPVSAKPFV